MVENGEDLPIVNFEKIQDFISIYKIPLILAVSGIILTVISLIAIAKPNSKEEGIVFSTEASQSGKSARHIKVDIEGSIVKPGVYEFNDGERVSDGIEKAGGLTKDADLVFLEKNMNKAAKLIDGGKIYIPKKGGIGSQNLEVGSKNTENTLGITTGMVNINSASQAELEALPGVGPVTAQKIISGRPYQSIDELKTKKSVGNALFDKIKEKLTV